MRAAGAWRIAEHTCWQVTSPGRIWGSWQQRIGRLPRIESNSFTAAAAGTAGLPGGAPSSAADTGPGTTAAASAWRPDQQQCVAVAPRTQHIQASSHILQHLATCTQARAALLHSTSSSSIGTMHSAGIRAATARPAASMHSSAADRSASGMSGGWMQEGSEAELFQQALEGVPPEAAIGLMQRARSRSVAGKMDPKEMADAMRKAVEVSARVPELKAEDLLASAIIRMQANELLHKAQRLKRVLPDTRLTTGLLGLDPRALSASIFALSGIFRATLGMPLPPKLLITRELRYLTSLTPETVQHRLEQLRDAVGRETTEALVFEQPSLMVRYALQQLERMPVLVKEFGVTQKEALELLCKHRTFLTTTSQVAKMQQLCSLLAAELQLPRQQLLREVIRQPRLVCHSSAGALFEKYKALAKVLPDAPLQTLLKLLSTRNAAAAVSGTTLVQNLQFSAQLMGRSPWELVQDVARESVQLSANFILQPEESMRGRVQGLRQVLSVPDDSQLMRALQRTPSLLHSEPRLLHMKLHFLAEQLVRSPPTPEDMQRLAALLCQGSERVLLLSGTSLTSKIAALQTTLDLRPEDTKAAFASCPYLLLLSKTSLVQRARALSQMLDGHAAARQLLATDASVLLSLSSTMPLHVAWMAAVLDLPPDEVHARALKSSSGRTLLSLKPETAKERLELLAGLLCLEPIAMLLLLLGGGYVDQCNLVRLAPSTLTTRAQALSQLFGVHTPQQLATLLQRSPALLKANPSSLISKIDNLAAILGHPPAERLSQVLRQQPQLLLLAEARLEGNWERLVAAVEGYGPWERQLRELANGTAPAPLARALTAGPEAVARLHYLKQTGLAASSGHNSHQNGSTKGVTLTGALTESVVTFAARFPGFAAWRQASEDGAFVETSSASTAHAASGLASAFAAHAASDNSSAPAAHAVTPASAADAASVSTPPCAAEDQLQQGAPTGPRQAAEAFVLQHLAASQAAGKPVVLMSDAIQLAREAGMSASTVRRALAKLQEAGRLAVGNVASDKRERSLALA